MKRVQLLVLLAIAVAFFAGTYASAGKTHLGSFVRFDLESTGVESGAAGRVLEEYWGDLWSGYAIDGTVTCRGLSDGASYSVWLWQDSWEPGWVQAGTFTATSKGTGQFTFETGREDRLGVPVLVKNANNDDILTTPWFPY